MKAEVPRSSWRGGSITGNTASTGGGGVAVGVGNHFIMTGGNITDNTSEWGNGVGVNISRDATFTMSDGTISNNKGTSDEDINGGGVSVNGTFTMTGGAITGNEASLRGGGVYFASAAPFTMSGGTISDNTTTNDSGGGCAMWGWHLHHERRNHHRQYCLQLRRWCVCRQR